MPRIQLKPNSPEYADGKPREKPAMCEMPGCKEHGKHKAPKHRGLNEYHHFCLDHVREYNKAWNFFEGMSHKEVEDFMIRSLYGDRPTWRYDAFAAAQEELHRKAWQAYNFSEKDPHADPGQAPHGFNHTPEVEAMAIMGLEPPLSLEKIKTRYKELAKKHHPDHNKGCKKSEELLKSINMAYTILKVAFEQYKDLPDKA